jgi:hypothetical protein
MARLQAGYGRYKICDSFVTGHFVNGLSLDGAEITPYTIFETESQIQNMYWTGIFKIASEPDVDPYVPTIDNCILYYSMDAKDWSYNGATDVWSISNLANTINHGVLNGSTVSLTGKINEAIDLSSSKMITVGAINNCFSFSFWINPTVTITTSTAGTTVGYPIYDNSSVSGLRIIFGSSHASITNEIISVAFGTGVNARWYYWTNTSVANIPTGSWSHLAIIWDGADYKLYFNGVDKGNATIYTAGSPTISQNFGDLRICWSLANYLRLDEVSIYNKVLSAANVATLYNSGSGSNIWGTNRVMQVHPVANYAWVSLNKSYGNLSSYTGVNSGQPTKGTIGVWIYTDNPECFNTGPDPAINLIIGSAGGQIDKIGYSYSAVDGYENFPPTTLTMQSGWNYIVFRLKDGALTGTPDWTAVTGLVLEFVLDVTVADFYIGFLTISESNYIGHNAAGTRKMLIEEVII